MRDVVGVDDVDRQTDLGVEGSERRSAGKEKARAVYFDYPANVK